MNWRAASAIILTITTGAAAQQTPPVTTPARSTVVGEPPLSMSGAAAPEEARRYQVQAAASNAAVNLREQILRLPLARDVDVRSVVDRTDAAVPFGQALLRAQQIGGARWVDDHTCQVRLEIPGSPLAEVLVNAASQRSDRSPIAPEALKRRLAEWDRATFFAIGSSAGGAAIEMARPHHTAGAWSDVDEATRRKAITEARQDAVRQVLDAIAPIPLDASVNVRSALDRPSVGERLGAWLNQKAPVTRVEFLDDLKVSVTIAPSARALCAVLQNAVTADREFASTHSIDWTRVQQDFIARVGPTIGTARAAAPEPSVLSSVVLPIQPPDWVDQLIDAQSTTAGGGPRLKIARAAQSAATEQLRQKFLALRITPQLTLADAVQKDRRLSEAVDRAMLRAQITKVDYRADGSVLARVSLDLQNAWDELRSSP